METTFKVVGGIALSGVAVFMSACTFVLVRMLNDKECRERCVKVMEKYDKKEE